MTLLWTLLTLFVDGKAEKPEVPATAGAITVTGEFAGDDSAGGKLNLPGLTPPNWYNSPSWMVAAPPVRPVPFDVFSPAARPPQDFPGLSPCAPVALVPCPAPGQPEEPPAVRHVSFGKGGGHHSKAPQETACKTNDSTAKACPAESAQNGPSPWKHPHARHYSPPYHPSPRSAPAAFDPASKYRSPPHHGYTGAICPSDCRKAVRPAGMACPVTAPGSAFPGAKKVKHVVSATYEVPRQTAEALEPIVEKGEGVLGCLVEGDEMTVTAHPPAQSAIARFLKTVVRKPRMISRPRKAVNVKFSKSKCSSGKCSCQGQCQCDCQCCGSKTSDQAKKNNPTAKISFKSLLMSQKAKAIERKLGIDLVSSSDKDSTCCKTTECVTAKSCPGSKTTQKKTRAVVHWKASGSQPVKVKIVATSDGVQLWTSDGARLKAKAIQLETDGIGKVEVKNGFAIFEKPKP